MSDFLPEQPALMSAVRARNIARLLHALSEQYAEAGMRTQSMRALAQSQWWLTYALSLSQTPPGAVDMDGAP